MSRQYNAKLQALRAYPTDRKSGVEMFLSYLGVNASDFAYEEGESAEQYIYDIYGKHSSKKIEDGGSAFPLPITLNAEGHEHIAYSGLTARDWFAGQALGAVVGMHNGEVTDPHGAARGAYLLADAMLVARKGGA